MYIRALSVIALFCLTISSPLEGRSPSLARHHHAQVIKKKAQVLSHITQKRQHQVERKRPTRVTTVKRLYSRKALVTKKRPQKALMAKKRPQRVVRRTHVKPQPKQTLSQRKKNPSSRVTPTKSTRPRSISPKRRPQQKIARAQKRQLAKSAINKNQCTQHIPVKDIPQQQKPDYLSLLPLHTQNKVKLGGLDQLLVKEMKGQGQTVAVIELSGGWQQIKDVGNGTYGNLPPECKANYKSNFLTPIGGPGLHPEQMNDFIRDKGNPYHGSSVTSVILDLAPQAKILPVSTYACYGSDVFYDTADALMNLSKRSDVSIINMSSGYTKFKINSIYKPNKNGGEERLMKTIYPPRLTEAFKAIAKAGKVVVIAAGNDNREIQAPAFEAENEIVKEEDQVGHLMQELDPETRKSIIVAGSYDLDNRKIAAYSNKPGSLKNIQDSFLLAPGKHVQQYDDMVGDGTSSAAPYICAAIANLTSHRKISPKRAVQALKDTAERRPDVATYGRGIIRADKALELLERAGGG
ncbi:MAG: S8 family serine peptidase [Alphaproteobacteria bacterium]|nr:S8 family serine peptidase [Alphaproteobacteria bacterium]